MARKKNEAVIPITVEATGKGINEAMQEAEKLEKQTKKTKKQTKELKDSLAQTGDGAKQAAKGVQILDDQMKDFADNLKAVKEALEDIHKLLGEKGITFNTEKIQEQIGKLKTEFASLNTTINSAFKDDASTDNWIRRLTKVAGDIRNIRFRLFGDDKVPQETIKVKLASIDKDDNPVADIVNSLKEIKKFQIPLEPINQLLAKLNEISRVITDIMVGLRLDSKLPTAVIKDELTEVKTQLDAINKEANKYEKTLSRLTGITKNKNVDENGKETVTEIFHTNALVKTAKQVYTKDKPDQKDIQALEKEIIKLLQFGADLENVNVKVGKSATNYFQIVKSMFKNYSTSMMPQGSGGLKDYLSEFFDYAVSKDSANPSILLKNQKVYEETFAKTYKNLLKQKEYYTKQLSFAEARDATPSVIAYDEDTVKAMANALGNLGTNVTQTANQVSTVTQFSQEQLTQLVGGLSAIVEWLEKINTALGELGTKTDIFNNLPTFNINEQDQIDDLAQAVADKNKEYLKFLEQTNIVTNSILDSIKNITIAAKDLDLSDLFKNFTGTQPANGSANDLIQSLKDIQAAEKKVVIGKKKFSEQAEEIRNLAQAYAKYKALGGTESIADMTKKRGLASRVEQEYIKLASQSQDISIPVNIVPKLTDDFDAQLQKLIDLQSSDIDINIKPNISDVVNDFIKPIMVAVEGHPVEVEVAPIVDQFIKDIQAALTKSLDLSSIKELTASIENALKAEQIPVHLDPVIDDLISKIKSTLAKREFGIQLKPIVNNFIQNIKVALDKKQVPVNIKPVVGKEFNDELKKKLENKKPGVSITPNNISEFVKKLQSSLDKKVVKIKVEPILKDFIKRCKEILSGKYVPVNFKPQNPIHNNGKPFNNQEMQQLLDDETTNKSQKTTSMVNGHIVSGKVVTDDNGVKRTYTVDQFGNEKVTEQTVNKEKQIEKEYKEILSNYNQILQLKRQMKNQTEKEAEVTKQIISELTETTEAQYNALDKSGLSNNKTKKINHVQRMIQGVEVDNEYARQNAAMQYNALFKKVSNLINNPLLFRDQNNYDVFKNEFNNKGFELFNADESTTENIKKQTQALKALFATYEKSGNFTKLLRDYEDLNKFMSDNTALSGELKQRFQALLDEMKHFIDLGSIPPEVLKQLNDSMIKLRTEAKATGNVGDTFFTTFKKHLKSINAQFIAQYFSIQDWIRYIRSAVSAVTELDSALNQLKIISNETDMALQGIAKNAYSLANNLGMTTTEVISSVTEWRRLGKSMEDSMILAEQAARLSTGGMMDINAATTSLISSMEAFKLGADEVGKVVDQYIYLGNNYAISSEQLATSLTKSMAALKVAGNSLEEIEALEVAGNTMVQDSDVVSNALKVLSMRLRGTTGSALEEIGEDTEGLIENFSKLNNKIQALTKTVSNPAGVSIVDKMTGGYKSTYQILLEISKVWQDIGDMQKAELLEIMAGKVRATAAAAILERPDLLESVYEDAMKNASGAGERAVTISMESIEKKVNVLKNNLSQLSRDVIDSDSVKKLIDSLNELIQGIREAGQDLAPVMSGLMEILNLVVKIASIAPTGTLVGALFAKKKIFNSNSDLFSKLNFTKIFKSDLQVIEGAVEGTNTYAEACERLNDSMEELSPATQAFVRTQIATNESTQDVVKACKKQAVATKALSIAQGLLNTALSIGLSLLVSYVVQGISSLIHYEENARKKTREMLDELQASTDEYKKQSDALKDLITKYKEYNDTLQDNNLTESEIYSIKQDLYDLQEDINNQYGDTANGIDLVNGKYKETLGLLEEIEKQERDRYIAQNAGKYEEAQITASNRKFMDELMMSSAFSGWGLSIPTRIMSTLLQNYGFDLANGSAQEFKDVIDEIVSDYQDKTKLTPEMIANMAGLSEDRVDAIREMFDGLVVKWGEIVNNKESYLNEEIDASQIVKDYETYLTANNPAYSALYDVLSDYVKKLNSAQITGDKAEYQKLYKITEDYLKGASGIIPYESILNDFKSQIDKINTAYENQIAQENAEAQSIRERAEHILNAKILGWDNGKRTSTQFTHMGAEIDTKSGFAILNWHVQEIRKAFEDLKVDTWEEINLFDDVIKEAVDAGMRDINDLFDLYKKRLKELNTVKTEVFDYADWLNKDSGVKNGDTAYSNNNLITAYKSSIGQLTDFIKNNKEGQVDVDFGDIVRITSSDELFKALNMDGFDKYIKQFGESYMAIFAYINDAEESLTKSLDMNTRDKNLLLKTLNNIKTEALGGSNSIYKLRDSYMELQGATSTPIGESIKKLNQEEKLTYQEMLNIINKYPELKEAVVQYSDGTYSIQKENIDNLIESYANMSNEYISYMTDMYKATIQLSWAQQGFNKTIDDAQKIYHEALEKQVPLDNLFGENTGKIIEAIKFLEEFEWLGEKNEPDNATYLNYTEWLGRSSNLVKDSKSGEKYLNNELISTYQSAIADFKQFLEENEQGEIEINLGKVATYVGNTELFKQLGMDAFETYVEAFTDESGNIDKANLLGTYIKDVFAKAIRSVSSEELTEEGYALLTQAFDNINSEIFGVSENVFKIEESYWELRKLQEDVNKGVSFTQEEAEDYMNKYGELYGAIESVTKEIDKETGEIIKMYKFQEGSIDSLVGKYASLSNEAITSLKDQSKYFTETIKYLRQMQIELVQATVDAAMLRAGLPFNVDLKAMMNTDANQADIGRAIAESMKGLDEETQKSINRIISEGQQRVWNIMHGSELDLKQGDGSATGAGGDKDKDNKSQYDWLDSYLDKRNRALQEEQTAYDRLTNQVIKKGDIETEYNKLQNESLYEQNKLLNDQILAYSEAEKEYGRRMNEGLLYDNLVEAFGNDKSKADEIVQKIINREDIALEEYTSDQASAISAMADNYNKQLDAADKKLEAQNTKRENLLKMFTNNIEFITKKFDHALNEFAQRQAQLEHYQSMRTNSGMMENQKLYLALLDNESRELEANIQKRNELMNTLNTLQPYTEAEIEEWWNTKEAIDATTQAIWESEEAIVSYQKSMRQLSWDLNDKIRDITGNVRNETSFLIDTLGTFEKDMYSYERDFLGNDAEKTKIYNGQMSDQGLATLALRRVNAKAYREDIERINKEIEDAQEEYLKNTADVDALDRLNNLISERNNLIQSYNDEREAILALVKDGYDKQLQSLQAITDKYMEAKQAEKDLYEYQKNIAKQTKNVANIRKQMQAYAGDMSEEARAKLQTLNVQLEEAEEGLADTQYDRQLQDQQRIFDHLYQSLEDFFNDKLEHPEQILKSTEKLVNDNMPKIKDTLNNSLSFYKTNISKSLDNILGANGIGKIASNIATVDGDIKGIKSSVNSTGADLKHYLEENNLKKQKEETIYERIADLYNEDNMFGKNFRSFNTKLDEINESIQAIDKDNKEEKKKKESETESEATTTTTTSTLKNQTTGLNGMKYVSGKWEVNLSEAKDVLESLGLEDFKESLYRGHVYDSWLESHHIVVVDDRHKKRAKGAKKISSNELAWTQENGLEAILRPTDNAILTPLKAGDSVLTAEATQTLWDFANNPLAFMKQNMGMTTVSKSAGVTFNNSMSPTIVVNGVSNANEFIRELQKNKQFESMIQDMTINQMNGGNSLAKLKYKF